MSGWQPIADLSHDEYVLGCLRDAFDAEECAGAIYFIGRKYHKPGRLICEWTGRSRRISHWQELPGKPV